MGQDGMGLDRPDQGYGHERDGNETGLDWPDQGVPTLVSQGKVKFEWNTVSKAGWRIFAIPNHGCVDEKH